MRTRIAALTVATTLMAAVVSAGDAPAAAAAASVKVNINQASSAQLALLPRIGIHAAERIVEYRKQHGAFSRPEELMDIKGIGEKLFQVLKPYIVLNGPTTASEKVRLGSGSRTRGRAKPSPAPVPSGNGK